MKIVSLQSVGLGSVFPSVSYGGINEPYVLKVSEKLKDGRSEELDITVTEINYQQGDFDAYGFEYTPSTHQTDTSECCQQISTLRNGATTPTVSVQMTLAMIFMSFYTEEISDD